ncbi:alcohol dehydrogenase-like regulatory protein ErcA [Anoxynatronum sibiricum]|uniref:Alcohol dehydrogenase-like regulatory protein ErcA n=1 Tax=Anoxynatronum sibiricum TaxID=210623 RepID=A0ABU9VTK5_9CLOT
MPDRAMKELRKFVVPEVIVGTDARLLAGRYVAHFGARRVMVVTDSQVVDQPWFTGIIDSIRQLDKEVELFTDVTENPKDYEVMLGSELFLANECDLIVAVGGGSPMDCAKGIGIVSTNGGHILDYEGVDEVHLPGPPLICIPTTAGTSADVSQFAIIVDTQTHVKKAIISKKVVPDLALIDPVPLLTMPPYLTACTGMDALTHAIEAAVSNARSELTDVHALEAVHLVTENLEAAVQPERTLGTMRNMMMGSLHAGFAFSNASLGAVHALAHSLGGLLDLAHGECNGILLEHLIFLNYPHAVSQFQHLSRQMKLPMEAANDDQLRRQLVQAVSALRQRVGIPDTLPAVTVTPGQIDKMAESALQDPCMVTNPKKLTKAEVVTIYEKLFHPQG